MRGDIRGLGRALVSLGESTDNNIPLPPPSPRLHRKSTGVLSMGSQENCSWVARHSTNVKISLATKARPSSVSKEAMGLHKEGKRRRGVCGGGGAHNQARPPTPPKTSYEGSLLAE